MTHEFECKFNGFLYWGTFELANVMVSPAIGFGPNRFEITSDIEFDEVYGISLSESDYEFKVDLKFATKEFLKNLKQVVINSKDMESAEQKELDSYEEEA